MIALAVAIVLALAASAIGLDYMRRARRWIREVQDASGDREQLEALMDEPAPSAWWAWLSVALVVAGAVAIAVGLL